MPKLGEIDAETLVLEVYSQAHDHARKLVRLLDGVGAILTDVEGSPIAHAVRATLQFAQTGQSRHGVETHMQAVAFASWGSPASPTTAALGHQETAIGLVYVAAAGRLAVLKGAPVDRRWLSALTGVATSTIEGLGAPRRGNPLERVDPRSRDSALTADSARAWLASRNVPGFEDGR